jgi:hypothetical protein
MTDGHNWQHHGPICICEDCGIVRHQERMGSLPPCDSTELDAIRERIHAAFMRKLAERYPDHPWVKKGQP